MKKLLSLLLCIAVISPFTFSAAAEKNAVNNLDIQSTVMSGGKTIHIENSKATPVSVNFEAKQGDKITLYITVSSSDQVAGLLSDLAFNTSYIDFVDYEYIYTGAFVNRISRGFLYYSILFGPSGTFLTNETEVIAFNFSIRKDISPTSTYITFTPLEYYDTNLRELNYSEIGYKIEKTEENKDTDSASDTDTSIHTDTTIDTDSSSETDTSSDTDTSSETDTDTSGNTDTDISTDTDNNTDNNTDTHTHTPVVIPAVPATCTQTGFTEGSRCSVCGEILVPQTEIPMTPHEYEDGKCKNCGKYDPSLKYGDINNDGTINSLDAVVILRFNAKIDEPSDTKKILADVNNNGNIDTSDAVMILRYMIGLEKDSIIGKSLSD